MIAPIAASATMPTPTPMPAAAPVLKPLLWSLLFPVEADPAAGDDVFVTRETEDVDVVGEVEAEDDDVGVGPDGTAENEYGPSALNVSSVGVLQLSSPLSPQHAHAPLTHVIHV